jgi:uncharacterized protein (UPF0332 family)
MAALAAARALIAQRLDRSARTHSGVRALFALVLRDDSAFPKDLHGFLGRAYQL